MSNVKQIMKKPITIENSASLFKAMTRLTDSKISRLLTTNDSSEIVGIITEKDIGFFLLVNDSEKNLTEIPVSDVAKPLIQVNESTPVEDVAHIMSTKNIGSIDYNDDLDMACTEMIDSHINGVGVLINDQLSGIVSKTDVVKALDELK